MSIFWVFAWINVALSSIKSESYRARVATGPLALIMLWRACAGLHRHALLPLSGYMLFPLFFTQSAHCSRLWQKIFVHKTNQNLSLLQHLATTLAMYTVTIADNGRLSKTIQKPLFTCFLTLLIHKTEITNAAENQRMRATTSPEEQCCLGRVATLGI